jgi:hypothetical protein
MQGQSFLFGQGGSKRVLIQIPTLLAFTLFDPPEKVGSH